MAPTPPTQRKSFQRIKACSADGAAGEEAAHVPPSEGVCRPLF
jgi:hypothetical protein